MRPSAIIALLFAASSACQLVTLPSDLNFLIGFKAFTAGMACTAALAFLGKFCSESAHES